MQTPSSHASFSPGIQSNYSGQRNTIQQQQSYNKPPSGQGMRQNPSTQSRSKYDAVENQHSYPSNHSGMGPSNANARRVPSRDVPPKYNDQYDKPPSNRGARPYHVNKGMGGAQKESSSNYPEEQKYQPQRREAPGRSIGGPNGGPQGYGNPKSNPGGAGRNVGGGRDQQQSYNRPPPKNDYDNYQDEVSNQVIPALKNKSGAFGSNLGPDAFASPKDTQLEQCQSCGRNFNQEALDKHARVCAKVFQQKRKEFNSQAHRIVSNEHKQILMQAKRQGDPPKAQGGFPGNRKEPAQQMPARGGAGPSGMSKLPKWKMQSEQFRQAMRAANGGPVPSGKGGQGGRGGYSMPAPEEYDDRIQCPHCGRKFAENAGNRHIPHCEQSMKKNAMRNGPPARRR